MKTPTLNLKLIFHSVLVLLCLTKVVVAQTVRPSLSSWQLGLFGQAGSTQHAANFQQLPGVPNCCPRFESGSGTALFTGVLVNYYMGTSTALGVRLGYASFSGTLQKEEATTVLIRGSAQAGSFIHTLDATLSAISVQPHLRLGFLSKAYVELGTEFAMMLTSDYAQQETIGQPSGQGTFLDALGQDSHSRIRNQSAGTLPQAAQMLILPNVTLGYELPLNRQQNVTLSPELSYAYGLTKVVTDLDWKVQQFRAGIALAYRPVSLPVVQQEHLHIDTLRLPQPNLLREYIAKGSDRFSESETVENDVRIQRRDIHRTDTLYYAEIPAQRHEEKPVDPRPEKFTVSLNAVAVDEEKHEDDTVRIQLRQYSNLLLTPLLNYIFFEDGDANLSERYIRLQSSDTAAFDENKYNSVDKLPTYYQLLNIVGKRLHEYPAATLRLIGCNSNRGVESGDTALSRKRAEKVYRYLHEVWDISPQRMSIGVRNLPEYASNPDSADGASENRRVELWSPEYNILRPIITSDTTVYARTMDVHLRPKAESASGVAAWSIGVISNNQIVFTKGAPGSVPDDITWKLSTEEQRRLRDEKRLKAELQVRNNNGESARAESVLFVTSQEQRSYKRTIIDSMEVDRYSLILFDVRSSELKRFNSKIIEFIKQRISSTSQIFVEGYTDRLGESNYNQALATSRAEETARALGTRVQHIEGHGEVNSYNNDLPEGRHYTRTVDIVVKTPLN